MKALTITEFIKKENNNLDLIRLICAYFVIYSHAFVLSPSPDKMDFLYKSFSLGDIGFGSIAVKTFFLISGLLITNSLLSNGNVLSYATSRFFRIYPAYFFVILISAIFIGPIVSNLSLFDYFSSHETWSYITKTLKLNIQYTLPGVFKDNALDAINGSIWTIPMEIKAYFYLMITYLTSILFGKYKKAFIVFVSVVIIIEPFTSFKGTILAKTDVMGIYLLYPFFSAGCLLAIFKERINTTTLLFISGISLFSFFWVAKTELYKTVTFQLFFSTLLLYISSLPLLRKIKLNNDISYGVYLWAFPTQQLITSFISKSPYINMVLALIITSILGYVSFHLIESPSIKFGKRIKMKSFVVAK